MAISVERFRMSYPEFKGTETALVEQKLRFATLRCSASSWGALYEEAVLLTAAHLLSSLPDGEVVRLKRENRVTSYQLELDRMKLEVTAGLGRLT